MIRVIPSSDPKFQNAEIFDGVGRLISELLIVFMMGNCVYSSSLYLKYCMAISCGYVF